MNRVAIAVDRTRLYSPGFSALDRLRASAAEVSELPNEQSSLGWKVDATNALAPTVPEGTESRICVPGALSAGPGPQHRLAPRLADATLSTLLDRFKHSGRPVQVSFRELLRSPCTRDRASHDLHPYPARLLVNIPAFFLSTTLTQPGDLVLDPFCGSGTVLLEAILAGRNAAGADANPLARLLTSVKLTPIAPTTLSSVRRTFVRQLPHEPSRGYPPVINLEYWFYPHVRRDLLVVLEKLSSIRSPELRNFVSVVFSACLKDVSLADPRLSVPVRLRKDQYPPDHWLHESTNKRLARLRTINVARVFSRRLDENIARIARLWNWPRLGKCIALTEDARSLSCIADNSVDLIITSPPYLGAQKYIRASSLSLTWLGLSAARDLRQLEDINIGREHYPRAAHAEVRHVGIPKADALVARARKENPLRAHIAAAYLSEMHLAVREIGRVLKRGRHIVLVAGVSRVCGNPFPTPEFLVEMAKSEGLALRLHLVDSIRSRALMTKRHHTAGRIDAESILLLQKSP